MFYQLVRLFGIDGADGGKVIRKTGSHQEMWNRAAVSTVERSGIGLGSVSRKERQCNKNKGPNVLICLTRDR